MDNRKKSLTGLTGSSKAGDSKPKRNVSPRKVISFSMLDEGDTSNAHTNSQLRLHEYETNPAQRVKIARVSEERLRGNGMSSNYDASGFGSTNDS